MAYDAALADRIRELLAERRLPDDAALTETAMFGGLAFLQGGHLLLTAGHDGGLLVRVGPSATAELVATTAARPAIMGTRTMAGWVRLDASDVATRRDLQWWVSVACDHARTLPAKQPKQGRTKPVG